MVRSPHPVRTREHGQVVVLFAMSLVVLVGLASLLYTGAQSLVMRRELQNVGDAAALAGANVLLKFPKGCSADGSIGGSPKADVTAAVRNSVSTNLPSYNLANVGITCPTTLPSGASSKNMSVLVTLNGTTPAFFGGLAGSGIAVSTRSAAVNGQVSGNKYSLIMLDPSDLAWGGSYNGCPSFLIGGGISANFEGSIWVDSTCQVAGSYVGAMDANGGSATVTTTNGAQIHLAGEYHKQNLTISPAPLENVRPLIGDPLASLADPTSVATLTSYTQSNVCKGANKNPCVLQPGIYTGGINTGAGDTIYMKPGLYVMKGGGFNIGPSSVYSIPSTKNSTTDATWATDCPLTSTNCGVLIYNGPDATGLWTNNKDTIGIGSNATVKLRAYNHLSDTTNGTALEQYDHLLFWQSRTPAATSSKPQPTVTLGGGGSVILSGTIYAPQAQVKFGGTSGGGGGGFNDITIQFICWDLQLQGNNSFNFQYVSDQFTTPPAYGLIQ
jgi:Putative Flp pilus-assembly TadE/G-like